MDGVFVASLWGWCVMGCVLKTILSFESWVMRSLKRWKNSKKKSSLHWSLTFDVWSSIFNLRCTIRNVGRPDQELGTSRITSVIVKSSTSSRSASDIALLLLLLLLLLFSSYTLSIFFLFRTCFSWRSLLSLISGRELPFPSRLVAQLLDLRTDRYYQSIYPSPVGCRVFSVLSC